MTDKDGQEAKVSKEPNDYAGAPLIVIDLGTYTYSAAPDFFNDLSPPERDEH